jgi:hypothetical protein
MARVPLALIFERKKQNGGDSRNTNIFLFNEGQNIINHKKWF